MRLRNCPSARRKASWSSAKPWPYTAELFVRDAVDAAAEAGGLGPARDALAADWRREVHSVFDEATLKLPADVPFLSTGTNGVHSEHLGFILAEMQSLQRQFPGGAW